MTKEPPKEKGFSLSWDELKDANEYANFVYKMKSVISQMHTALPVMVKAVKGTGTSPVGLVDVQPLVTQMKVDGQPLNMAVLTNVPYCRIQGGANAYVVDPEPGDIGIAVFASRDISGVKNAKKISPPSSRRMYSISDAMYIGGILNKAPTQWVYIKASGEINIHATQKIVLDAPLIECHGNLTQTGRAGQTATFVGGITNTGGDIVSNGISLEHHKHPGISRGNSKTDEPE